MEQKNTMPIGTIAVSAIAGSVLTMIVGFSWGGWTTEGNATAMARVAANDAVKAALVPVCVAKANADPELAAKLAILKGATSYQRDDKVMEAGWATLPGSDEPNRSVADACADALLAAQA